MLIEVAGTRHSARQHDQVGICIVALLKLNISLDVHTVSRLYQRELCGAHRYNLHTASTQYIDGYQRLDIFEAVC